MTTVATLILVNVYAAVNYEIPSVTDISSDLVSDPFEITNEPFDEQPGELFEKSEDSFANTFDVSPRELVPTPANTSANKSGDDDIYDELVNTSEPPSEPTPTIESTPTVTPISTNAPFINPATPTAAPTETAEPYSPFIEKG